MKTIDLRKQMKELWIPPVGRVVLVTVPAMPRLFIERAGNPTTPLYTKVQFVVLKLYLSRQKYNSYPVRPCPLSLLSMNYT